jgi:hypothetical protein
MVMTGCWPGPETHPLPHFESRISPEIERSLFMDFIVDLLKDAWDVATPLCLLFLVILAGVLMVWPLLPDLGTPFGWVGKGFRKAKEVLRCELLNFLEAVENADRGDGDFWSAAKLASDCTAPPAAAPDPAASSPSALSDDDDCDSSDTTVDVPIADLVRSTHKHPEPIGTRFYDQASHRNMMLVTEGTWAGWISFQNVDGRWVSLRPATVADREAIAEAQKRAQAAGVARTIGWLPVANL